MTGNVKCSFKFTLVIISVCQTLLRSSATRNHFTVAISVPAESFRHRLSKIQDGNMTIKIWFLLKTLLERIFAAFALSRVRIFYSGRRFSYARACSKKL